MALANALLMVAAGHKEENKRVGWSRKLAPDKGTCESCALSLQTQGPASALSVSLLFMWKPFPARI